MVMRKIVVVGDKTTTSGVILPNANSTFSVGDAGHKVALIGDQATCLACKGVGLIAKAGGPRRMNFMGEVALENDVVICGCPVHPKVVANLHQTMTYDDGATSVGSQTASEAAGAGLVAAAPGATNAQTDLPHDEMVQLDGPGAPSLAGMFYRIEVNDGRVFSGVVPDNGEMPRIGTATQESYDIYWGDEALARGDAE
ncbi:PAAR domain-containing protein [Collimonas sp. H4R21]|uniref:PAAR domain-containing protein n=1 Tax=Collimonas rhizosphaerae TaxID=3126357 RepID=A0ABU9PY45_9BURK